MPKYRVNRIVMAAVEVGVYEADNHEDAVEKALCDDAVSYEPPFCDSCVVNVLLGDGNHLEADLIIDRPPQEQPND